MTDLARHPAPVPIPDMAVWRLIATCGCDLSHLPVESARIVRARAWGALRDDRGHRTGINPDAITPQPRGEIVALPARRAPHRVTILPPTSPGDAA